MHICVNRLTIIGSDNGLSPGRRQAIFWTNDGILLIRTLGTNFSEIVSAIRTFSLTKMHLKMSAKWRMFCLGLNVLKQSKPVCICCGMQWIKNTENRLDAKFVITGDTTGCKYDNLYRLSLWQTVVLSIMTNHEDSLFSVMSKVLLNSPKNTMTTPWLAIAYNPENPIKKNTERENGDIHWNGLRHGLYPWWT